jgi:endonuclease III
MPKKIDKATSRAKPRPRKPSPKLQLRATQIYQEFERLYPDAHCALTYDTPFQLLIATILSAQCTDVRVNMVTPVLFKKYKTPKALANASQESIEEIVRSTGFYRNKAKSIKGASMRIVEHYQGKVPQEMADLLTLPGVARKTANVVLGNAFGKNIGVVVDTHIGRLSQRMGLTKFADSKRIEQDLMRLFPHEQWTMLAHLFIFHGRQICSARKPLCDACTLSQICDKRGVKLAKPNPPA